MPRLAHLLALGALLFAFAPAVFAQNASSEPRLLSTWDDPVKLADGTETVYRYEITHDYASGLTVRTAYDPAGAIVEQRELDEAPTPSREEIEWAVSIIQQDEELGSLAESRSATIQGGFVLTGDELDACAAPARCLQFDMASPDRLESVRFVVVDLRTETIVERNLFPDL